MSTQQEKLAKMKALFGAQDSNNNENRPSNYYRFWKMDFEQSATIRLLPDANENNEMEFTVEKFMHNLEINGEFRSVPCLKMYGEECPICAVSSAFYKEEGKDSVNGKKYWRKKQNIMQALVIEDPLAPNAETGENSEGKICYINAGFQLFSVIKEALTGGDLEAVPWDMREGYDFIIKKTKQGENAKYDLGSKFVRRQSSLTDDEIAHVEEEGIDLATLIPGKPAIEKVEAMLNAALTGEHYEDGFNSGGNSVSTKPAVVESTPTPTVTETTKLVVDEVVSEPVVETPASAAGYADKGNDVLEMIKNRKRSEA